LLDEKLFPPTVLIFRVQFPRTSHHAKPVHFDFGATYFMDPGTSRTNR
jgi:hypothetical protein